MKGGWKWAHLLGNGKLLLINKNGCSGVFKRENERTDGDSKDQELLLYMGSEERSHGEPISACWQPIRLIPLRGKKW